MFDQREGARHLPFFSELASLEDGDPSWRTVSAGLVVLRLVDTWIEEGAAAVAANGWGLRSVEAAIEEVEAGLPARSVLQSVVSALKSSPSNDMRAIAPRLLAYGRALDLEAKWALAAVLDPARNKFPPHSARRVVSPIPAPGSYRWSLDTRGQRPSSFNMRELYVVKWPGRHSNWGQAAGVRP